MVGNFIRQKRRVSKVLRMRALRPLFGSCGKAFWFDPNGTYSFSNIHVGDHTSLGVKPTLVAGIANIRIGSHVMFGPEVVVIAGGHNPGVIGMFMPEVTEKSGNEDLGVVIEDECWIGARAIILRGVDVGRGSIVGAGSVVTRSVPPYTIVAGNPARALRSRFSTAEALEHERRLYPSSLRLSDGQLSHLDREPKMLTRRTTAV